MRKLDLAGILAGQVAGVFSGAGAVLMRKLDLAGILAGQVAGIFSGAGAVLK